MTEHEEQVVLMRLVEMHLGRWPELGMLYAVPNGSERNVIVGRKLKAEGVKKGVPDLCLPVPRGGYHGLYVELKRQKKSRISPEQVAWINALQGQGYKAEICLGATEAWEVIREYVQA
jgi:hypothetical protein